MEGMQKYQPSVEEVEMAAELMGAKQKKASEVRAAVVESIGTADPEYINDINNLEIAKGNIEGSYWMEGKIKGHKISIYCRDDKSYNEDNFTVSVDGSQLNEKDAYKIGDKYRGFHMKNWQTVNRMSHLGAVEMAAKRELFREEDYDKMIKELMGE